MDDQPDNTNGAPIPFQPQFIAPIFSGRKAFTIRKEKSTYTSRAYSENSPVKLVSTCGLYIGEAVITCRYYVKISFTAGDISSIDYYIFPDKSHHNTLTTDDEIDNFVMGAGFDSRQDMRRWYAAYINLPVRVSVFSFSGLMLMWRYYSPSDAVRFFIYRRY